MSDKDHILLREDMFLYKNDTSVIDKIHRKRFYGYLEDYDFDRSTLKIIFESDIHSTTQQNNFNIALRKINKYHGMNLIDCVLFLGEFNKIKKIVYFLDDETKYIIKLEFAEKYNVEVKEDTLSEFIDD